VPIEISTKDGGWAFLMLVFTVLIDFSFEVYLPQTRTRAVSSLQLRGPLQGKGVSNFKPIAMFVELILSTFLGCLSSQMCLATKPLSVRSEDLPRFSYVTSELKTPKIT